MNKMRLKMNPKKTELMLFGSYQQLTKLGNFNIKVIDDTIDLVRECKYLGAW